MAPLIAQINHKSPAGHMVGFIGAMAGFFVQIFHMTFVFSLSILNFMFTRPFCRLQFCDFSVVEFLECLYLFFKLRLDLQL